MYMLRTEIRKLGGLICFLFVMLAIQAQQYTVTGGNGVPYLLENPGNRIRVYLVYGMDNVEISYTSSSTNHNGIDISKRHWTGNPFRVNRMGRHPLSGI